ESSEQRSSWSRGPWLALRPHSSTGPSPTGPPARVGRCATMRSVTTPDDGPARPTRLGRVTILLTAVVGLGALSIDMFLPSLPALARAYGTDAATAQLTVRSEERRGG